MVSELGQRHLLAPEPPLPPSISRLLFFVPLLISRAKLGLSITALSDAELIAGGEWLVAQPWIDQRTRQLTLKCLAAVPSIANSREPEHGR
jgi:hypothetical protein